MQRNDPAAERGNPSYVWRAGQERRLSLLRRYVSLEGRRILDVGCGIGMYTAAFMQFSSHIFGVEIESDRAREATERARSIVNAVGESLPFADATFDVVFSHEVLEHVSDDSRCAQEMVRVARPGGYIVVFVPNRLYFFETHGVYWRGSYRFGNKPLINWLPRRLRDRLAPHVRAYTVRGLRRLFVGLPVQVVVHTQIYPGYDNILARRRTLGRLMQSVTYGLEHTGLRHFGLSHFMVLQKQKAGPVAELRTDR